MISESGTFRSAVTLSIVAHIVIFGSALAFAQYYRGFIRSGEAVVTVSLVSGRIGGGTARKPFREMARRMPLNSMPPAFPVQETMPAHGEDVKTGEAVAAAAGGEGAGSAAAGRGEGAGPAAAIGADSGMGMFSSEQWTQLYSAIEQAKTYPRLARERGIEGTVLVRFKVLPSGTVENVNVVRSSGTDILDDASVRTVYRAGPMPFVSGWIEVPLSYVLK